SRCIDRFRPPYGKRPIASPRQCVFCGTCNQDTYLKDETGGRRFWPIRCGDEILLDALQRDRNQLWAEAVHRFNKGESWWLDSAELVSIANEEQSDRFEADPWQPDIAEWLIEKLPTTGRQYTTSEEILETVIQKRKADWTQIDKNRVARCLTALGWRRLK